MAAVTFEALMKQLKAGQFAPVYLLHGAEGYFIDRVSSYIESNAISDSEKVFNQVTLYGKEVDSKTVIDNASQYPMMAQRRVVILKEAQSMRDLTKLESYVRQPPPTTTLVICHPHKKIDGRSAFAKTLAKNAVVFESKEVKEYQMGTWVQSYLKGHGYTIDPPASDVLVEYLGNDLAKVANELEKLMLSLGDKKSISRDDVFDNIGISKDYNVFELQSAIALRDSEKVFKIVSNFMTNMRTTPFVVINATLYSYFAKLFIAKTMEGTSDRAIASAVGINPYFVREYKAACRNYSTSQISEIIEILREYDLRSKGINRTSGFKDPEMLREMVYKMYHVGRLQRAAGQ